MRQRGTGGKDEQGEMKTAIAQHHDDDDDASGMNCSLIRLLFYSAPWHSAVIPPAKWTESKS